MLAWIIAIPFFASAASLLLGSKLGRWTGLLMTAAAGGSFLLCLRALNSLSEVPQKLHVPWIPDLGVSFDLRGDGFGLFFASLVSGIGVLVGSYALAYLGALPPARLGRFFAALSAFMGAMLGIALADHLMLLFAFWELTSLTSFLLIGYWYEQASAKQGALTALQVTGVGGLVMMAGFVLIGIAAGTFSISEIQASAMLRNQITQSPWASIAAVLVLGGAFTKSAQFPAHFWLPGAMVAPTPVSAYLHSATMVKAGVFLVGRMLPILGEVPGFQSILLVIGLFTFVFGAWNALHEYDLKATLAHTTVSMLGMFMAGYGLSTPGQDALQLLSHATYKGSLFLLAGIIEHAMHTRDIRQLGGLRHKLPWSFVVAVAAAMSMAGLPPTLGFVAKETFYAQALEADSLSFHPLARILVIAAAVLGNGLMFAVALRLVVEIFLGNQRHDSEVAGLGSAHQSAHAHAKHHEHHGESLALVLPPALLTVVGLAVSFMTLGKSGEKLLGMLSSSPEAHVHMSMVPSHLPPVLLTAATIALGLAIFRLRHPLRALRVHLQGIPRLQDAWQAALQGITAAAESFASHWQTGSLRWYLSLQLGFLVLLTAWALSQGRIGGGHIAFDLGQPPWYAWVLLALLGVASVSVATAKSRLGAAIALSASGFLTSLVFVLYRSPDILLTQILIETVSTIFVLLILFFMPPFKREDLSALGRLVNIGISLGVGLLAAGMVLLCMSPGLRETDNLALSFLSRSLPEGGGQNAVNVIIVDIRAMDTIGEITVLVVVCLCVYGMLRARRAA